MSRYFFILLLLLCCRILSAQTVEVKRSGDLITLRGESYYLHVVDKGQTLFAISKAYGVDVETILKVNRKTDPAISIFDVLKIPYVAPYAERDETYYYHIAQPGETVYSIARQYGLKPRQILKENKQYEDAPLSIGNIVRLPLKEIREEAVAVQQPRPEKEPQNKPEEVVPPAPERVPETGNLIELTGNNEWVPGGSVKVAVLLPLHARATLRNNLRPDGNDTLSTWRYIPGVIPKWEGFLHFYEGLLLAADSLKRAGFHIDLYTYDTEYVSDGVHSGMSGIAGEINREKPDLIIGPVYGSEYRILAEQLENKEIPVVYPLSARTEEFGQYPNFIQVNTPAGSVAEKAAEWIATRPEANVICFYFPGDEYREEAALARLTEQKMRNGRDSLSFVDRFHKWYADGATADSLSWRLKADRENVIIIPTAKEAEVSKLLPMLSAFAGMYKITVVGLPEWQNFTSVDFETFYKLNVTFFLYSFTDHSSAEAGVFADRYRTWFGMEPHTLSNKAYDIGLYFIPLAARFKGKTLEAIGSHPGNGLFSSFRFSRFGPDGGWENRGLVLVQYGSDYTIRTERLK